MTTKIKTNGGNLVAVSADGTVTVDNVVISFEQQAHAETDAATIALNALKKIATYGFDCRGYSETASRTIRRTVWDALRKMGAAQ